MSLDERVSDIIKDVYAAGAAEDPARWDAVGERILQVVGGCAGLTTLVDLQDCEFSASKTYGRNDTRVARALEEYGDIYKLDPSLTWASEHPNARFCDSSKTLPADEYLSNELVKWNCARMGATHWYVGYTPPDEHLSFSFSVHFPSEQGPGRPEAIRLFKMLFDHMDCAMRLSRRPFNPNSARALFLLDATGCVQELSQAAQQLISRAGPLNLMGGRLTTDPAQQAQLDRLLAQVASAPRTGAGPAALQLMHPSGCRPWIIAVRPLISGVGPFGNVRCELLVEVHDCVPKIGSLEIVQSLFELTERELQVVRLLADGHSVESLSATIHVTPNTVRAHLRSIFWKTSTGRQSELLQLCAGLANT